MRGHLLYQDLADALVPVSNPIEIVNVDSWIREPPNPVLRKSLSTAILAGSFFFFNPQSIVANDKVPDWHPRINEPYFTKKREVNTGEFRFEVPRTILLSDWWQPAQQPYFSKRRDYHTGESRFEVPRTILISDWWQPASLPVLRKVQRQQGAFARLDIISDDTQLNEWYQPASEPYFSKKRNYFTGEFRFETPRAILISDWFVQSFLPTRLRERRQTAGITRTEFVEPPETVTLDKWFRPASEPYFSKKRNYFTGEFRFELPRAILLSDWFQEVKQPYFSKRRFYLTGEFRFEQPREILISDWFREIIQPRKTAFRQVAGEIRLEIIIPEDITLDKWFMAVVQPYIRRVTPVGSHELKIELSVGREFIQAIFM